MQNKHESSFTHKQQIDPSLYTDNNFLSTPQEHPNPPAVWQDGRSPTTYEYMQMPPYSQTPTEYDPTLQSNSDPQPDPQDLLMHLGFFSKKQNSALQPTLPHFSTNEERGNQVYHLGSTLEEQPIELFQPQSIYTDPYQYKEQPYPHNLIPVGQQASYNEDLTWNPSVKTPPTTYPVFVNPSEPHAYAGKLPNEYSLPHPNQTQTQINNLFLGNPLPNDLPHEQSSQVEEPPAYGYEQLETDKKANATLEPEGYEWTDTTQEERSKKMPEMMSEEEKKGGGTGRRENTTPEQRSAAVSKGWKKRRENTTPEQRSAAARDMANARWKNTTKKERSAVVSKGWKKRRENTTPEQRSAAVSKGWEKRRENTTPEQRSAVVSKGWEKRRENTTPEQRSAVVSKGWKKRRENTKPTENEQPLPQLDEQ